MKTVEVVEHLLAETRDEELDCDRVLELLPPYLDGRIDRATLREQLEHHTRVCPECAEELAILRRALGVGPPDRDDLAGGGVDDD